MNIISRHKRLISNIFSLSLLDLLNLLIPLITLPYLMRTIGASGYGAYSISYSIIQYVIMISAYGFGFSSTRLIAQNKDNKDFVCDIFHSTIAARCFLGILFSSICLFIIQFIYKEEYFLYMTLLGLGMILGDILNPVWLYQGLEEMKYMTIVNFVCKVLSTCLIFMFIKSDADFIYVILYNSIGFVFSGLLSYLIAINKFDIPFRFPCWSSVVLRFKEGLHIFLSTIFMNLYRNSNVLILGAFLNEHAVGIYSAAEKVIKAGQIIASPISTALYPNMSASFKNSPLAINKLKIRKVSIMMAILLFGISMCTYILSPFIGDYFLDNRDSVNLIKLMVPVIFFGGLNYILGIVGLTNLGYQKFFLKAVIISGLISVIALFLLVKVWGNYSAGVSMCLAEMSLFMLCLFKLIKIK